MTRTPPPELEFSSPPCPICENETGCDSDSFWCTECGITWDAQGGHPEWDDPDEAQCESTDYYTPLNRTHRCLKAAGHELPAHRRVTDLVRPGRPSNPGHGVMTTILRLTRYAALGAAGGAAAVIAAGAGLAIAEHRALARVAHGKPRALHGWLR